MPRERLSTAAPLQHSTTAHMATPATPATPLSRDRIPACPAITLKCRLGKKEFFLFFEGVARVAFQERDRGIEGVAGTLQQSAHVITSEHISFRGA